MHATFVKRDEFRTQLVINGNGEQGTEIFQGISH